LTSGPNPPLHLTPAAIPVCREFKALSAAAAGGGGAALGVRQHYPAVQRLEGILLGLAASIVVACLWPRFPLANEAAPLPPPASPGEMEV
jgi:hypothetical protein